MIEGKKANMIIVSLAVVILLLLVQIFVYNGRLDTLASQVSSLQGELNGASQQLYGNLTSYMDSALRQAQSLVESYDVSYNGVDAAAKTVNVRLKFRLKDVTKGAHIKVYAVPVNSTAEPGEGFEAVTGNGVDFTSEFSLSYSDDYNLDIYQADATGNNRKMNTESIPVFIKSELDRRTSLSSGGTGISSEGVEVNVALENRTFGQKDFQIKKVELILLAGGREAVRKDVTDRSIANAEDIDRYNLMAAAGDTNIANDLPPHPEIGRMRMDPEGVERGFFLEFFPNDQINGASQGEDSSPGYGYAVEVTYENGEVLKIQ